MSDSNVDDTVSDFPMLPPGNFLRCALPSISRVARIPEFAQQQ